MAVLSSVRRRLLLLMLLQSMTILFVFNFYSNRKVKDVPNDVVIFSKEDPRLLLMEMMADEGNGYDYIAGHAATIQTVFKQMEIDLNEKKKSLLSFLSRPTINNHSFTYLHNPDRACLNSKTDVLIIIPSAPGNFQNRKNIRNGEYSNFTGNAENKAQVIFFIGLTKSNQTQTKIDEEYETYEDIVQESFEDIYRNIRLKSVSMLKWVSTYCRQASYVIRNDDDITVNLTTVVEAMNKTSVRYSNFILGRVRVNDLPARNPKERNSLTKQEYREPVFPPFALGGLLGFPTLTVELLYQAALRVQPIWLDDVYITGICAPHVGVKLINDTSFAFKHKGKWAH